MSDSTEISAKAVPAPEILAPTPAPTATPAQRLETVDDLDMERVKLLTRVLIGAASEGGGYLLEHLRRYQAAADDLAVEEGRSALDQATRSQLLQYLAVGAAVRTQRRTLQLAARGIGLTLGSARRTTRLLDRLTDNPVGRPLRRPAVKLATQLRDEVDTSVVVGHREVQEGSFLVREAALDIVDEFIAYISESPELADLVSEQIGQQGIGMATAVAETGRELTGQADRGVEDKLRGWLGLPPRSEMPQSPFVGKPESIRHPTFDAAVDKANPQSNARNAE